MIQLEETAAVVALLRRGDRLWHHYAALIEEAGSALAVLRGEFEEALPEMPGRLFDDLPNVAPENLEPIVEEIAAWRSEGIDVITILDEGYPPNLRTIHNRPPILFVRGRLVEGDRRSVAVVGSRSASDYGLRLASEIAGDLAGASMTVLSGLALGIDAAAHTAALGRGGRTVAVIGTGIRRSYPKQNEQLQASIAREAAVVSQFWPDAPPTKTSFPMRNVVMSGMALATVVIEAGKTSGARMQARLALEHGRPVFLTDRLVAENEWAEAYADRPGAFVIANAEGILSTLDRINALDRLTA